MVHHTWLSAEANPRFSHLLSKVCILFFCSNSRLRPGGWHFPAGGQKWKKNSLHCQVVSPPIFKRQIFLKQDSNLFSSHRKIHLLNKLHLGRTKKSSNKFSRCKRVVRYTAARARRLIKKLDNGVRSSFNNIVRRWARITIRRKKEEKYVCV